jgi:GNAT superfamily N-acetyltransferase
MNITQHLKTLALLILREYSFYHIYSLTDTDEQPSPIAELRFESIEKKEIDNSSDMMIIEQAWYHSQGTYAYACMEDSRIVGLCFFWYGEGYRKRNFWPLADQEANLVQLFVLPEMRGRGIGRNLIQFAIQDMFRKGFKRVYARIWRSNTSSLQAFRHAGWNHIATVIELSLRGRKKPFRLERHIKPAPPQAKAPPYQPPPSSSYGLPSPPEAP